MPQTAHLDITPLFYGLRRQGLQDRIGVIANKPVRVTYERCIRCWLGAAVSVENLSPAQFVHHRAET